ncbi:MAG: nucleotidyltransferase family protein [Patescibacteria group bacterium]
MNKIIDKRQIQSVCEKEHIKYLGIFGSHARGEESVDSDVDILVNFEEIKSYFQLGKIQAQLEQLFKRKVDLVLQDNIKKSLERYILKDLITLYEKR